uniref:Ribosomal protein L23 n=1 Tax=Tripsacum laxum TaxID=47471 RepID=A0A891M8A1_9POAL|nr:ribosomal protein L23 [Tripsacum laxum]QRM17464.1 ribosomal protein L23 [Tripsacum laxum]
MAGYSIPLLDRETN